MGTDARTALVTGATGFIGGRLVNGLADDGWQVRALVRDRGRAGELAERGIELVEGDDLDAGSLRGAGDGVERRLLPRARNGTGRRGRLRGA
jgi:uncharacterized protein YbjT (DUF2867 family)